MRHLLDRLLSYVTSPFRLLLSAAGRLLSVPRRLLGLSLPAQVAILVFVFLIICVITAYTAFYYTQHRISWSYWVSPLRILIIASLVLVIPIVVYQALRLWLQGEASRFPDIDYAWSAGLDALARNDLDLTEIPIFLVLGSSDEAFEKSLFDASRLSLRIREIPQGPAALHWYANPDGIYLVCTDTSCLSKLAHQAKVILSAEAAAPVAAPARAAGDAIRGTIIAGNESRSAPSLRTSGPLPSSPGVPPASDGGSIRGTMMIGGQTDLSEFVPPAEKHPIALAQPEAAEQERRLEYVCQLLRRARRPLCPINGILTLLPFGLVQRGPREGIEVQRAVKRDLAMARQTLSLRCPVTALVVGMEMEAGFRELVRRVGRDRAAAQRFGRGFSLWNPPLPERLEALAAHACGAFEDWVYNLFREKGALSKPGNTKLYALLCKVRRNVQGRLANILVAGYGSQAPPVAHEGGFLFGGCYFAGTGETEDRQAFVKGVFDKLPEQQEEVEWTVEALMEDERYQRWAKFGLTIDSLLLLSLIGMVVYQWFWKGRP